MIGVDMTKISRFQEMTNLEKFCKRYNVPKVDALEAAKTWACLEAVVKAEGTGYDFTKVRVDFPQGSRPIFVDEQKILPNDYVLSLSHEGDMLVAVALTILRNKI